MNLEFLTCLFNTISCWRSKVFSATNSVLERNRSVTTQRCFVCCGRVTFRIHFAKRLESLLILSTTIDVNSFSIRVRYHATRATAIPWYQEWHLPRFTHKFSADMASSHDSFLELRANPFRPIQDGIRGQSVLCENNVCYFESGPQISFLTDWFSLLLFYYNLFSTQ